jgi:hypothetical protein
MPSYVIGTPIDTIAAAEAGGLSSSRTKPSSRLDIALRGPISEAQSQASRRQEVLDERGRPLRFHGAFTGGFSAGYFNTVGSAEGWTPSTFVSSRTKKAERIENTNSTTNNSKTSDIQAFDAIKQYMDAEDEETMGASILVRSSYTSKGAVLPPGDRGDRKRSRDEEESTQQTDLVPKNIGNDSIGIKLLEYCGWRQGQRVGLAFALRRATRGLGGGLGEGLVPRTEEEALTRLACIESERKLEIQQEKYLDDLWKCATSRPPKAKFGVAFDPQSVRQRQSATEQIYASSKQLGNDDSLTKMNHSRLQMSSSALLGRTSSSTSSGGISLLNTLGESALRGSKGQFDASKAIVGNGSSSRRVQQPLYTSRTSGGLLSFDLDDDGDDDAAPYRQPSLLEYDIQSTSGIATGFSASRSRQELLSNHHQQNKDESLSHLPFSSVNSLLTDKNERSTLLVNSALCADGRTPLLGFSLATRHDTKKISFAKSRSPLVPPLNWVPRHEFNTDESDSMNFYSRFGYHINNMNSQVKQESEKTDLDTSSTSTQPSTFTQTGLQSLPKAPNSLVTHSSSTFFDKFSKSNSSKERSLEDEDLKVPANVSFLSRIPKVGSINVRTTTTFLPSKLLLKRFKVSDPFTASERQILSSTVSSSQILPVTMPVTMPVTVSTQSFDSQFTSSHVTFPSQSLPSTSIQKTPPDISSATVAAQKIAATLAPILYHPPRSLFEAIFGSSFNA